MYCSGLNCGMLVPKEPSRELEDHGFTEMFLIVGIRIYIFLEPLYSQIFMAAALV